MMTNAVAGPGLAPDAAMVTFPIEMFLPGSDITPVETRKREFYEGLTRWTSALARGAGGAPPTLSVEGATAEDALARANHVMLAKRWGDGLPLRPPTRARRLDPAWRRAPARPRARQLPRRAEA